MPMLNVQCIRYLPRVREAAICPLPSVETVYRERRQRELTNNKTHKVRNHFRNQPRDILGFVERQKITIGLGYKTNKECYHAVLSRAAIFSKNAKIVISGCSWYIPHYTPNVEQQTILSKHVLDKALTEVQIIVRSVFFKK